jgi:hypothetical protein
MAVNTSQNMRAELEQGVRDGTYIQLNPGWSTNTPAPVERLSWPNYQQVERHTEAAREILSQISPREPAPKGNLYHTKKPGPDTSGTLLGDLNAS